MRLTQTVRVLIGLATTVAMLSGGTAATFASSSQDGAVAHSRDAATSREDVHAHPPRHHRHRAATTVDVVIHDAAHNVITAAPVGTSVHASATVSGAAGTPTGTIDFTWYASPDCSTVPVPAGTGLPLVAGVVDPSDAQTAPVGGGSYEAHYSGDTAYRAATSACIPLVVEAPALASIAVTPADPSIVAGTTQQFAATGTYTDASTADLTGLVTWASDTTAAATIDATGIATGVAAGTATISATLGSVNGATVLTVTAPAPPPAPTLASIAVTPADPSIVAGLTQQFVATGTYSDNSTADLTGLVTWASDTAATATVDATGLATGVAAGTSTISATLGSVSGATVLTVTAPAPPPAPTLASIAVTPVDPSILAGTTQQFVATGTYSDASVVDISTQVTWASDTAATATVDATGLATGVAAGTATISATLAGVNGGTVLTVTAPPPPPPAATLLSIAVTPVLPAVALGATKQFVATGTYSDSSTADISTQVTWTSSDATVATVNTAGLATGVAIGTATIGAALGSVSDSTVLTVDPAALVTIAVTPALPTIAVGATQQFVATGTYSDATTADLSAQVTWASSDATVATIDATGLATGAGTGPSTITATLGAVTGSDLLTVGSLFTVSGQVMLTTSDSAGNLLSFVLAAGPTYTVEMTLTTSVVNLLGHEVPRQFIQVANAVTVEGLQIDATTIQAQVVVVQTTKDFP